MATTTSTGFPVATENPYTGGGGNQGSDAIDNDGGASGSSSGDVTLSRGAMIAIILVVVIVAVGGVSSSVLFYLAKKREWKIRESIRRSARKVVTALTPRRSEFPRSLKDNDIDRNGSKQPSSRSAFGLGHSNSRSHTRLDDVPATPRLPQDLEKGLDSNDKSASSKDAKKRLINFSRK